MEMVESIRCMSPDPRYADIELTSLESQTAIYAQGVGLGASKGKEIGKYSEGYSGYVSMAQDAVRVLWV